MTGGRVASRFPHSLDLPPGWRKAIREAMLLTAGRGLVIGRGWTTLLVEVGQVVGGLEARPMCSTQMYSAPHTGIS